MCALLSGFFEATLAHSLVIAFFLTMVLGLNESVSAQSMTVTIQNLRIVQVRPEENIILVCGAVPGSNGSYVVVRPAKKKSAAGGGKTE